MKTFTKPQILCFVFAYAKDHERNFHHLISDPCFNYSPTLSVAETNHGPYLAGVSQKIAQSGTLYAW